MGEDNERRYFPSEDNLDKKCSFWGEEEKKCEFPNVQVEGRRGCKGTVDEVCLFFKNGRQPTGELRQEQVMELESRALGFMEVWVREQRNRG